MISTPVAFLIFNRPEPTRRVFEEIRRAQPPKLLVIADGPRANYPEDTGRCAAARKVVAAVDWPCKVMTNYSDVNLGCRRRVSSGLDWVFDQVEEAIILEDDCLPHPSFFRFCEELLARYRKDERVFHISGDHFRSIGEKNPDSYYFSRMSYIWGWATWRRAWKHYDVEMASWPHVRDGGWLRGFLGSDCAADSFARAFDSVYSRSLDTWDLQWGLACWMQNGLSIRPHVNLVSNIGFDRDGTHTKLQSAVANLPTEPMMFPLKHPLFMMRNAYEDRFSQDTLERKTMWRRAEAKLSGIVRRAASAWPRASQSANGRS